MERKMEEKTQTIFIGQYGTIFVKEYSEDGHEEMIDGGSVTVQEMKKKYPNAPVIQLIFDPKTELVINQVEVAQ
jgi:hypothetical protein